MRSGGKLFILAGAGLGVIAILLAGMAFLGSPNAEADQAGKEAKVTVVETVRDVPAHTLLTIEDLIEVKVSESDLPADAVRTRQEVLGMAYRVPLVKGQRLVASQIELPGLRNEIAEGKRAMAVSADTISLLSGLVQDDDYIDIIFYARLNEVRLLGHSMGTTPEDEVAYKFGNDENMGWVPIDFVEEFPQFPATGDAGSQMFIRDDVGEASQLEPVAKLLLQDLHVLRVVRPGETFDAVGQPVDDPVSDTAGVSTEEKPGYLVVEVSNQQAELLTFIQDEKHTYQVIVRAKDDHEVTNTTGITYQILATNESYALPLPGSVISNGPGALAEPGSLQESQARGQELIDAQDDAVDEAKDAIEEGEEQEASEEDADAAAPADGAPADGN